MTDSRPQVVDVVTVPLVGLAKEALDIIVEKTGHSETDSVNRALIAHANQLVAKDFGLEPALYDKRNGDILSVGFY